VNLIAFTDGFNDASHAVPAFDSASLDKSREERPPLEEPEALPVMTLWMTSVPRGAPGTVRTWHR
jgi:hypothetical protein